MKLNKIPLVIFSAISIFLIYTAYNYAKSVENCKCAKPVIQYINQIKNIEYFLLILSVIGIIVNILTIFGFTGSSLYPYITKIIPLLIVYFSIYFSIISIFIYDIFEFLYKSPKGCDCIEKWQKDILIVQGILYTITFSIILSISAIIFVKMSR